MSRFSYLLLPFLSLRCLYVGWLGLECGHVGAPPSAYVHHYLWPGKATILERLCPCYLSPLFRWPSITTDLKHCSVVWFGGEGDDQLCGSGRGAIAGCHCMGAIVVCYCCGEGDDELWEWTWCHCRVPLWCAMVGAREGDVTPERRNEVFWQKNLLIGCGGGHQQEGKTCLEA